MAPGSIVDLLPHEKEQYRQGYKDGYEAGKAALRRELKALLDSLKSKEAYATYTSTYEI